MRFERIVKTLQIAIFILKLANGQDTQKTTKESVEDVGCQLQYLTTPPPITSEVLAFPLGIVPYYIDEEFDDYLQHRIKNAMAIVEDNSCVKFKEESRKPENSTAKWLHFTNPDNQRECNHEPLSGTDGEIIVVLGFECLRTYEVLHSVLHGLGFSDEVTHPHRDQYIKIQWENIQPKYRRLFSIQVDGFPHKIVEYDPMSIMHFHDRAYSVSGGITIAPLVPGLIIKPSVKLSQIDVMKLRLTFGHECNKRRVGDLVRSCKDVFYKQHLEGSNENKLKLKLSSNPLVSEDSSRDKSDVSTSMELKKTDENGEPRIIQLNLRSNFTTTRN